jgi:hypothetical protein
MTKDENNLLTPDELVDGLKEHMGGDYFNEFMKEMNRLEKDLIGEYPEDHVRVRLYKKSVHMGFDLFVLGIDAEESSPIYKTFKEFKSGVELIVDMISKNSVNKENPNPKERAFIFGVSITLCIGILEGKKNDGDFESKTWDDITPEDVKSVVNRMLKEYAELGWIIGAYPGTTIH